MTPVSLSFAERLVLCWVAFFRVLFDGQVAARFRDAAAKPEQRLPEPAAEQRRRSKQARRPPREAVERTEDEKSSKATVSAAQAVAPAEPASSALLLLRLLQSEGRLVDFLQQDIAGYDDVAVATAVRVVHEGCRKVLRRHVVLEPVRSEAEGASVEVPAGFDAQAIKLTGNVSGGGPFRGILRHHGWRAERVELPQALGHHDSSFVAPAEIEVS